MQFKNFADQIKKDIVKYNKMYKSQISELEKSLKDMSPEQQAIWKERNEAIKMHVKNQDTKGLISIMDEIKSEIG
jgi:sugar-specific transcriptional regulator TrmB